MKQRLKTLCSSDAGCSLCTYLPFCRCAGSSSDGVVEAPSFVEPLCSLEVVEGDVACFTVTVAGRPAPRVSWRHNGSAVVDGQSPYFEVSRSDDGRRHSLTIGEVFADDAGTVDVTAENDVGAVSATAHLTVTRTSRPPNGSSWNSTGPTPTPTLGMRLSCNF